MTGSERTGPPDDAAIYVDASAFIKLFIPEPESNQVTAFLRGRTGLVISELVVTECISVAARHRREGRIPADLADRIRETVRAHATSGAVELLDITGEVHREAERLMFASERAPLRALDALHLAAAVYGSAAYLLTFDRHMRKVARISGLDVIELPA